MTPDTIRLLLSAGLGITLLLVSVLLLRLHAFVALLLASLSIGLAAGMPPSQVLEAMQRGMGGTLGFIAIVVGLGAMLGKMLEHSGGAELVADRLVSRFGPERSSWALMVTGLLVSIPVFFDVALVILIPVVYGLSRKTGRSALYHAIPLMAGLVTSHAFVPPTPGPTLVAHELGASLGKVVAAGLLVGLPTAVIAGPVLARWLSQRVGLAAGDPNEATGASTGAASFAASPMGAVAAGDKGDPPPLSLVLALILGPLCLMVLAALVRPSAGATVVGRVAEFVGHPFVALLLAVLFSVYALGIRRGVAMDTVRQLTGCALEPAGVILLVTGAGGVLKQVMVDSKVGEVLAQTLVERELPLLLVGFLLAVLVRVLQGSATVAMVAAAALLAPVVAVLQPSDWHRALLVVTIAAGATALSHVNDSGFWLVNRYLGLSVADTLRSWTLMTALVGVCGFVLALMWSVLL